MSWQDRDYNQAAFRGPGLRSTSMVTWLLGINTVVWLLDTILTDGIRTGGWASPAYWGNFNVDQGIFGFQVWRLFTYQFLHAGFLHLLFNMIGLYFFGPMVERWWGSKRFLAFYLLCGASGALLMTVMSFVPGLLQLGPATPLVGASGSVFGVLVGAAVMAPRQTVMLLFPPIPMQMRTLVLFFLGIAVLSVIVGSSNGGGEAAHLGGALLGFVLMKNPRTLDWADHLSPFAKRAGPRTSRVEKQKVKQADLDAQVDRILDKVKAQGLQSLTGREKKILKEATDQQKQAS